MYKLLNGIAIVLLSVSSAQAALVNFSLTGYIDGSDAPGPYGLSVGSAVTASGVFDDSAISISPYTVYFDLSHGSNAMTIVAGSLILSHMQDDNYAVGGSPKLEFNNSGSLIGVGYNRGALDGSTFDSGALAFVLNDASFSFATGYWDANSFTMMPVPVPAAAWLFGSGFLGLGGAMFRRRKQSV